MRYDAERCALCLTVEELCAMAHKSGSIDARRPAFWGIEMPSEATLEKMKKGESAAYQTAVPLTSTVKFGDFFVTARGTAHGVLENGKTVTVDMVGKGKAARGAHLHAELCCLAHFLCEANGYRSAKLRVRVPDKENGTLRDYCSEMTDKELRAFYFGLLERVSFFLDFEVKRQEELIPTVSSIAFPYESPREGQTELAESVFRAVRRGEKLFAQAPTGIGKTMSTLYPAVKAVGQGYAARIFYLTARASARREAYAAAAKLHAAGARLRTVVLYAKEQLCLCEGGPQVGCRSRCTPEDCPYASGYYDRVDAALMELLSTQSGFPRVKLLEVAKKHRLCPYELSLDLSRFCEIIICDYNYVFDPTVYLRRYFGVDVTEEGEHIFLVDEAHNLPDRARDMYSAVLSAAPIEALYARVDAAANPALEAALGALVLTLRRLAGLCTEHREKHADGTESGYYLNRAPLLQLSEQAQICQRELERFLRAEPDYADAEGLLALVSALKKYCRIAEHFDERFLTYMELAKGELTVKIFCLDPSLVIRTAANRARAAIFFSATLAPLSYFADVLGGGKKDKTLSLTSPFDPKNLSVTAVTGISTRMEDRAKSYRRVASYIAATVSARAGNYMVYFPSYEYLNAVHERFSEKYPEVTCIVQHPGMRVAEREAFLAAFKADEGHLRVGFCVLGGSFSEGVDLPGSRLIGTVIVGVGIPSLSSERNILRDYYQNKCECGYDYAYTFPGMNNVLQAAGRVIRCDEDRGVVVLIDSRYGEEPYLHLYPPHWQDIVAAGDAASLAARLGRFWGK